MLNLSSCSNTLKNPISDTVMKESFLHFIWQFQYFNKSDLRSSDGEIINILHPGFLNDDSGPDFLNTKVMIGNITWNGNVEIHIKSSDWNQHNHQNNEAYENVILHVVWQDDKSIFRKDGTKIPTIELKNRVSTDLILKYNDLMNSRYHIPCADQLQQIPSVTLYSMLDKALSHRLQQKADFVNSLYIKTRQNWEEAAYQLLAKNFGFKINSEAFLELSKILPYKLILKHSDNLLQIEALLFGQAGLLEGNMEDPYFGFLQREFSFLKHKYGFDFQLKVSQWKFLRLRPANFPTIRIAQFAAILHKNKSLFSFFTDFQSYNELFNKLKVTQSDYWLKHYNFATESKSRIPGLGTDSVNNLIINTAVPLLAALSKQRDNQEYLDKAIQLLESLPKEENRILKLWNEAGIKVKNSYDSQALIELYNNFCLERQCLTCKIGTAVLK